MFLGVLEREQRHEMINRDMLVFALLLPELNVTC